MNAEREVLRLFVAVCLSEEVRAALGRLQEEMQGHRLSGLRWVRPEGIHVTLKFLGETPAGRVPAIGEALATATRGKRPFRLALGPPGMFGGRRAPRVVWVGLEGDQQQLRELQQAVDGALAEVGFEPERRAFSPHLTVARVRQPAPAGLSESLARALDSVEPPRGEFGVREVVLMRSTLQPGGAVYDRLATLPLQ